jgi:uncharacterized protein YndB with AHSA1/START domain
MTKIAEITQLIDGTPDEVFRCWLVAELIEDWWGPDGFTTKVLKLEAEEGGAFIFQMTSPDGESCNMTGTYQKIDRPTLLVFDVDSHCNIGIPPHVTPQLDQSRVTVTFKPVGGQTELTVQHSGLGSSYMELATVSWGQTMTKFATTAERS